MKNRHFPPAITGTTLASVTLLALGAVALANGIGESLINHSVGLTIAAFLAIIGYEDWKDAQRERRNKRD